MPRRTALQVCSTGPFAGAATCSDCGTAESALAYRSGRVPRCIDCQHYWNLAHRSHGRSVPMEMDRATFLAFKRSDQGRHCHYCGIDGDGLFALDLRGSNGRRLEVIGIDRVDNERGYERDNIVACCAVCNGVKSNLFSAAELMVLGPVIRRLLEARLAPMPGTAPALVLLRGGRDRDPGDETRPVAA